MRIELTKAQALRILQGFGQMRVPIFGHGMMLPGDAGSIEHDRVNRFQWVGTESELVRLSKKLGIIRTANPTARERSR